MEQKIKGSQLGKVNMENEGSTTYSAKTVVTEVRCLYQALLNLLLCFVITWIASRWYSCNLKRLDIDL